MLEKKERPGNRGRGTLECEDKKDRKRPPVCHMSALDIGQVTFDAPGSQLLLSVELPQNSGKTYIMRIAVNSFSDAQSVATALGIDPQLISTN